VIRREFLRSTGAMCAGIAISKAMPMLAETPSTDGWKTYEVTARVEVLKPSGVTHIWLPAALIRNTPYQKTLSNKFVADGGTANLTENQQDALGIVSATYAAGAKPVLTLTSVVSTRNYTVDLSKPPAKHTASKAELAYFLQPSQYVPVDGIVLETATKATAGTTADVDKAHALYEWVVLNTFRDPKVRGCGRGDIRFMLESGDMGGKCADINALYVGLARAVGIPARHVYGLRIGKSEQGYKSLGLATDRATKGQHCRVEIYLKDYG